MNPFSYSPEAIAAIATDIRTDIIRMLYAAGTGHSAGPLGMADVFAALYFAILSHDPNTPTSQSRDRLILSCGHICPVLYATLARAGYFPIETLTSLRTFGSPLQGHPSRLHTPGIETSSGPLGQGISQAIGIALSLRLDESTAQVYCVMSDGEHNEGQVWEALMSAAKFGLKNLTVLIDRNNIQIDGLTSSVMPLEPLREKYESFGWHVMDVNGHDIQEFLSACSARNSIGKPVAIICHTTPGKGVGFMEERFEWHGKTPNAAQAYEALLELRSLQGRISHD